MWTASFMMYMNTLHNILLLVQITKEKEGKTEDPEHPKHGKVDPNNDPHVGGNTWAGGTGGRDTAGLGGVGGPYRLDAGHDVTQVSQADKDAVPEEVQCRTCTTTNGLFYSQHLLFCQVRRAAREMAQKAYKERLRQIEMSEFDGQLYETYSKSVRAQVKMLRVILENLQVAFTLRERSREDDV